MVVGGLTASDCGVIFGDGPGSIVEPRASPLQSLKPTWLTRRASAKPNAGLSAGTRDACLQRRHAEPSRLFPMLHECDPGLDFVAFRSWSVRETKAFATRKPDAREAARRLSRRAVPRKIAFRTLSQHTESPARTISVIFGSNLATERHFSNFLKSDIGLAEGHKDSLKAFLAGVLGCSQRIAQRPTQRVIRVRRSTTFGFVSKSECQHPLERFD